MESWGNKNYKLLRAGIMSIKKERASETEFTPLRELNQEWNHDCPPAQTKSWANALPQCHAEGSSLKLTVMAKCKERAAGQALTGETWRKTRAHPHTITPPGHIWNKYTWLILSESVQFTKKCLEILHLSGASALRYLWKISQKNGWICYLLSDSQNMGPELLGIEWFSPISLVWVVQQSHTCHYLTWE